VGLTKPHNLRVEVCGQVRAAGVADWRTRLKTVTAAHSEFNLKVFVKML
jgi:hypothetical protein